MSLIKDIQNTSALSVGEHSLTEVLALAGIVMAGNACPSCGGSLSVRLEQREGYNSEEVSYCRSCGFTGTP